MIVRRHSLLLLILLSTLLGPHERSHALVVAEVKVIVGTTKRSKRSDPRLARYRRTFRSKFRGFRSFHLDRSVSVTLATKQRIPVSLGGNRTLFLTYLGATKRQFIRVKMELLPIFRTSLRIRNGGTFMYALDKRKAKQVLIIAVTLRHR